MSVDTGNPSTTAALQTKKFARTSLEVSRASADLVSEETNRRNDAKVSRSEVFLLRVRGRFLRHCLRCCVQKTRVFFSSSLVCLSVFSLSGWLLNKLGKRSSRKQPCVDRFHVKPATFQSDTKAKFNLTRSQFGLPPHLTPPLCPVFLVGLRFNLRTVSFLVVTRH